VCPFRLFRFAQKETSNSLVSLVLSATIRITPPTTTDTTIDTLTDMMSITTTIDRTVKNIPRIIATTTTIVAAAEAQGRTIVPVAEVQGPPVVVATATALRAHRTSLLSFLVFRLPPTRRCSVASLRTLVLQSTRRP
jgi:hypothetical protein